MYLQMSEFDSFSWFIEEEEIEEEDDNFSMSWEIDEEIIEFSCDNQ